MRRAHLIAFIVLFSIHLMPRYNDPVLATPGVICIIYPDGKRYSGGLLDGTWHGQGRLLWPDGAEYDGAFIMGVPHGEGLHFYPDGRRRRVTYAHGRLVLGTMLSNNELIDGACFGEYRFNGSFSGWFRGDRIRGYLPHGRGIMRYLNGSVYSGQWHEGKMHGNGAIRWEDGSSYMGGWERGKRTGNGSYTWANGDRYVGGWRDNRMFGHGVYYYRDGRIVRGCWDDITVRAVDVADGPGQSK